MDTKTVDFGVVLITNMFNLLIFGIMLSRPKGWRRLEHILGIVSLSLVIPLSLAVVYNLSAGREWWTVILPGLLISFLLVEGLMDYVLKYPFRQSRWLGPYLFLFYISQWGMIGYAFLVNKIYGFITLVTYFLSLGATAYSYARVGHGSR
jgi:hypothetical protein